jgi:hypothetical protein
MCRPGWRGLLLNDSASEAFPDGLPLDVAAIEHQVGAPGRCKLGIGTMPPDQQVGGSPDVEVGDHGLSETSYGLPGRLFRAACELPPYNCDLIEDRCRM